MTILDVKKPLQVIDISGFINRLLIMEKLNINSLRRRDYGRKLKMLVTNKMSLSANS